MNYFRRIILRRNKRKFSEPTTRPPPVQEPKFVPRLSRMSDSQFELNQLNYPEETEDDENFYHLITRLIGVKPQCAQNIQLLPVSVAHDMLFTVEKFIIAVHNHTISEHYIHLQKCFTDLKCSLEFCEIDHSLIEFDTDQLINDLEIWISFELYEDLFEELRKKYSEQENGFKQRLKMIRNSLLHYCEQFMNANVENAVINLTLIDAVRSPIEKMKQVVKFVTALENSIRKEKPLTTGGEFQRILVAIYARVLPCNLITNLRYIVEVGQHDRPVSEQEAHCFLTVASSIDYLMMCVTPSGILNPNFGRAFAND